MEIKTNNPMFASLWSEVQNEYKENTRKWIQRLKSEGFKASHPNDGWVNREINELHLAYPQFDSGVEVGDLVMLGWPDDKKSERPVRIIGLRKGHVCGMIYWKFEDMVN
ncbi:MAG: hypothetical protein OEY89_13480 [Gammaproteobacteria bacterium]|nr:hypothetical protein [Gammaproteobacteria bacterium]